MSIVSTSTEYFSTDVGWTYTIGLPVEQAVEVLTLAADDICPLPVSYSAVLGAIGWRGQLVWTIALDLWLSLPSIAFGINPNLKSGGHLRPTLVLQNSHQKRTLACLIHNLNGIETIDLDSLDDLPDSVPGEIRSFFRGKAPQSNTLILNDRQLFDPQTWSL
jgi:chemotaxis signal transduction protein